MKKIWRFLLLLLFLIPSAQAADPNAHQFGSQGWMVYSDCSGITANGMGCWNGSTLCIGNGTSCAVVTGTSGCTTFSCLAGIPNTIAGHNLTGVVEPYDATILNAAAIGVSVQGYNSYLTGINQDVSTAGSPTWVGATVGAGGFTATKQPGVAGLMTVYNAATTSTLYWGIMGATSLSRSYSAQVPSGEPAGQVMSFAAPAGTGDPNGNPISAITWITPFTAATTLGSWTSGAGTVALGDTYLAALQKIDGNVAGKANVNADTTGLTAANVPAPTTTVGSGAISVTTKNTYVICTTTCAVTLPVAAAGIQACIRNAPGSATAITLVNRASQYYELTTHAAWATVNQKLVSGGVATDSICVVGYDATHYATFSSTGTWTDTAP